MKIDWKKLGLSLLYPHLAVIICLLPISVAFLVYSLIYLGTESIVAIISYLLSFYVLLVICFRIPRMIDYFKKLKSQNKYIKRWFSDVHLRMNVSVYGALVFNLAFAIFQLGLGFYHKSFWFYSMFVYYLMLGVIRFYLVKHLSKYKANEKADMEIKKYLICGVLLLVMNLALAVIIFFIVYFNKTFYHHMITTIAMAAFTFSTFIIAIINLVRYKKYKSPVYSAVKIVSFIAGCVSMLTLETTMLTTFGESAGSSFSQLMLSLTGAVVSVLSIVMAIRMIVKGTRWLKEIKKIKQ